MPHQPTTPASTDPRFDATWRADRPYLLALATRTLHDPAGAEDVVQEAFSRLARVPLDEIDDVRGWLSVVVRRLCLNRLRAAYFRHESVGGAAPAAPAGGSRSPLLEGDPADRVTLDDQVQLALAVVLDRLTPAERTAFVLHDVFGFPFDAIAAIVGRTPAACRQLASRARRSIQSDGPAVTRDVAPTQHQIVVERFIAACAGGDITALMAVLDPEVDGHAELIGHGTIADLAGRPAVAQRLIGMFGPGTDTLLLPVTVEGEAALVAYAHGRLAALVRFDQVDGFIRHMRSFVLPPSS